MKILMMIKDILKRYFEEFLLVISSTMIPFAIYITTLNVIASKDLETLLVFRTVIDTNKLFNNIFIYFMILWVFMLSKSGLRAIYYSVLIGITLFKNNLTTQYDVFYILMSFSIMASMSYQLFEIIFEKVKERFEIKEPEDINEGYVEKEYLLTNIGDNQKITIGDYDIVIQIEEV